MASLLGYFSKWNPATREGHKKWKRRAIAKYGYLGVRVSF